MDGWMDVYVGAGEASHVIGAENELVRGRNATRYREAVEYRSLLLPPSYRSS